MKIWRQPHRSPLRNQPAGDRARSRSVSTGRCSYRACRRPSLRALPLAPAPAQSWHRRRRRARGPRHAATDQTGPLAGRRPAGHVHPGHLFQFRTAAAVVRRRRPAGERGGASVADRPGRAAGDDHQPGLGLAGGAAAAPPGPGAAAAGDGVFRPGRGQPGDFGRGEFHPARLPHAGRALPGRRAGAGQPVPGAEETAGRPAQRRALPRREPGRAEHAAVLLSAAARTPAAGSAGPGGCCRHRHTDIRRRAGAVRRRRGLSPAGAAGPGLPGHHPVADLARFSGQRPAMARKAAPPRTERYLRCSRSHLLPYRSWNTTTVP